MSHSKSALRFLSHVFDCFKALKAVYPQELQKITVQSMLMFVVRTDFSHSQKVMCLFCIREGK